MFLPFHSILQNRRPWVGCYCPTVIPGIGSTSLLLLFHYHLSTCVPTCFPFFFNCCKVDNSFFKKLKSVKTILIYICQSSNTFLKVTFVVTSIRLVTLVISHCTFACLPDLPSYHSHDLRIALKNQVLLRAICSFPSHWTKKKILNEIMFASQTMIDSVTNRYIRLHAQIDS